VAGPSTDVAFLLLYILSVITCFSTSTWFHAVADQSPDVREVGNRIDHLGIVIVLWGSGMSAAHFAFYCDAATRMAYFTLLCASGLGCGIFTLQPHFRSSAGRTLRSVVYCTLGASLFLSIFHAMWRFGPELAEDMMGWKSFFGLAAINFSGALLYAFRIPERWFPVTFDLIGQSHNLLHTLVIGGAMVRLIGIVEVVERWRERDAGAFCRELA
jgi:adiponectin receptor